jgi:N-methylhydantoinase A
MIKIAIDTGGTFTDFTSHGILNGGQLQKVAVKNPTNHLFPAKGILEGLHELAESWGTNLPELLENTEKISLGTTLALNALLEKNGVKTALFTTKGFRDALEIRRSQLSNQWDLTAETPEVLVPRRFRFGIEERLDYKGDVIRSLNEDAVKEACQACKEAEIKAIAVSYLFSFLNPDHEKRTAEIIRKECPEIFVSLSSEVSPRIREYERTTTTVINAYCTPVLSDYLSEVKKELKTLGWNRPIFIMKNSGGLSDTADTEEFGVTTLLSGPAGGAVGNETLSRMLKRSHCVLADMGGTSFDLHVVNDETNQLVSQTDLEGYPLTIPMIEIHSIGAGGGSIVHVGEGGQVNVGPDSAGSVPGPACYNLGGEDATVTDALVVLGLINVKNFLSGKMNLSVAKAEAALKTKVADPLGITVIESSRLIYSIAAEMMADAVRLVTTQKGNDPRKYSLISAGGAFGLFAARVMTSLNMPEVIFPSQGPVFCSWGMLGASCRTDLTASVIMEKKNFNAQRLNEKLQVMRFDGENYLTRLNVPRDRQKMRLTMEMRYVSQHHEISVPWDKDFFEDSDIAVVENAFYDAHQNLYEYAERDKDWEIIDLHLACYEAENENVLFPLSQSPIKAKSKTVAGEIFGLTGEIDVISLGEGELKGGCSGPALVDLSYTTLLVPQGFSCQMEDEGIIVMKKEARDGSKN